MTLQDLRDVLDGALDAAYKLRDRQSDPADSTRTLQLIDLLRFLDDGVRRTMEKRAKAVEPWPDM